ncbi:GntR family transcriptional regulator [Dactylosporangium sp. NPDC000521]|uniref:GntR family transcriptional regulator n=1 Tax=Dactylosporangium sp. NPDC000521 TaxID=3363975 RepID=UPI0036805D04
MVTDVDADSPVYVRVAAVLRQEILDGVYPAGASLPPEDGIGRMHGVGRMSVRRAIDVLRHEGLITTERGRPAQVRAQPARAFVALGGGDVVVARMPSREQAQRLRIPVGVPLLEVHRTDGPVETYPADQFAALTGNSRRMQRHATG